MKMRFLKLHKVLLTRILCVVLAVAMGILCAACVGRNAKFTWGEMSSTEYSYIMSTQSQMVEESGTTQVIQPQKPAGPTIIRAFMPADKKSLPAGARFDVVASARVDCTKVTATFYGETITLQKQSNVDGDFVDYTGSFTLPMGNEDDRNVGGVKFYAEWQGHTQECTSPGIICLRDEKFDRVTVVEVIADSAETFDGNTTNDNSDPRLSYLPKGTVDFKVGKTVYDNVSGKYYYKMRFGRRVYVDKPNPPDTQNAVISKIYEGTVPDVNEISCASNVVSGHHTYITFNTAWKAPFTVDIAPQNYANPSIRDFTISSATCSYVDIKFCYTKAIGGNISVPSDNPLFLASEIIPAEDGYVLRLYLKRIGAFYGWDAYYNENGQLVFKFLNPTKVSAAQNEYGTNLSDIKILIDVGHGGRDSGAGGLMPNIMPEAERNLLLSALLKIELEKMGATVLMTRYDNTTVTAEGRCSALRNTAPDLCISIHHDSASNQSNNGCGVFCFNALSHNATVNVFNRTRASGIYKTTYKKWHYFYLARISTCPVVLIENGFISSPIDFTGISDYNTNVLKAKATAQGVADYFRSIQ